MCYDDCERTPRSDEARKRSHMEARIGSIWSDKWQDLRKNFYMDDDRRPDTYKDMIERIQAGKFILDKEDEKKDPYYSHYAIQWRDPSKPKDEAGFDASMSKLTKARTATEDAAALLDVEEGFKALQDFESATFH